MHFTLDKQEKHCVIRLHEAKLNTLIAAELKSELLIINNTGYSNIVLDLTETQYCDSSGLSSILTGNRLCKDTNGKFILCGLQPSVLKVIQIAQLDKVLLLSDNEAEAIKVIEM